MVDLREDRTRVARQWRGARAPSVPLAVAAAFTFHRTCRIADELLLHVEYNIALDIAAAALSRLLPIFTVDGSGEPVAVAIDLARQRFRGGGAEVVHADGTMIAPLSIDRGDLPRALTTIGRTRLEYLAPRREQRPAF